MFAADRDLLVHEPDLFSRVRFAAQSVLGPVDGVLDAGGTTLLLSTGDALAAGVGAGSVAVLSGLGAVEVTEVLGAQTLIVSRLRDSVAGAAVSPSPEAWSGVVSVSTFRPQIGLVHRSLLCALGVREGVAPAEPSLGEVYESQLVDLGGWRRAEALGALHLVLSAAAVSKRADDPLWRSAARFGEAFERARDGLVARIDVDGDGEANAARAMSSRRLRRG